MSYSELEVRKDKSLIYIAIHFYNEYGHGIIADLSIPALELLEERIKEAKVKIRKMGVK